MQHVEQLGYESYGFFRVQGVPEPIAVRMEGRVSLTPGEEYSLVLGDAPVVHVFDAEGKRME